MDEFLISYMLDAIDRYVYALRDTGFEWYENLLQGGHVVGLELAYEELYQAHGHFMSFSGYAMPTIDAMITEQLTLLNANPMVPDAPVPVPWDYNMSELIICMFYALVDYENALLYAETAYMNAYQLEDPVSTLQLALRNLNEAYLQFLSVYNTVMPPIDFMILDWLELLNDDLVDPNAAEAEPVEPDVIDGSEEHNREHAGTGSGEEEEQDVPAVSEDTVQQEDTGGARRIWKNWSCVHFLNFSLILFSWFLFSRFSSYVS